MHRHFGLGRYLCNSLENQQIYFMDTSAYRRYQKSEDELEYKKVTEI